MKSYIVRNGRKGHLVASLGTAFEFVENEEEDGAERETEIESESHSKICWDLL